MFFFNGRIRNAHIAPMILRERNYSNKVGHGCIIIGCLVIIFGLLFIITGFISETKKTTFFAIGIAILGAGCFLTILVCFYTKLNIMYHNWAYGPHIITHNQINSTHIGTTTCAISISGLTSKDIVTKKSESPIPLSNEVIITHSKNIGKIKTNRASVT